MEKIFKDCTIILISHRFNVVKTCDKLFVVDNGEIIEKGIYDNLIKDKKVNFLNYILKFFLELYFFKQYGK